MTRPAKIEHVAAVVLAGAVVQLFVLQAFGTFGGGSPTEVAPSPMPLALLYFIGLGPLALGVPVVAFWCWGLPLFWGAKEFPARSVVLAVAAIASSAIWLVVGDASKYYSWLFFALSGGLLVLTIAAVAWCRRRPSFPANLAGHALLFAWLGSFAFPWVGEVP